MSYATALAVWFFPRTRRFLPEAFFARASPTDLRASTCSTPTAGLRRWGAWARPRHRWGGAARTAWATGVVRARVRRSLQSGGDTNKA